MDMHWRKLIVLMTVLLVIPVAVSALNIDSVIFDPSTPNGRNDFYNSSFDIIVNTSASPVNITVTLQPDNKVIKEATEVSTPHTITVDTSTKEGDSYDFLVEAVNSSNSSQTDNTTTSTIKIDGEVPEIFPLNQGGDSMFEVSNATANETINIDVEVQDSFVDTSSVRVGSSSFISMNNTQDDEWHATTTPENLGCSSSGNCTLTVEASDQAGNSNSLEEDLEIVDQQQSTASGLDISVIYPENDSQVTNSYVKVSFEVDASDAEVPSSGNLFCEYSLVYSNGFPADGENVNGGFSTEDFNKSGSVYSMDNLLIKKLEGDDEEAVTHNLEITCYDESENPYTEVTTFQVEDTSSPDVVMDITNVTETTANITLRGEVEDFYIKRINYRDEFTAIANASNVSVTNSGPYMEYEFQLTNLTNGTLYFVRAEVEDEADNGNDITENFETLGGNETEEEEGRNAYELINKERNVTREPDLDKFAGRNFSYGISWIRQDEPPAEIPVGNFDMNLRKLIVSVREDIRDVGIDMITSQENQPVGIDDPTPSNSSVFEYYLIDANYKTISEEQPSDDVIKFVKIRFEVNTLWLDEHDINMSDVALFRYQEGEGWNQLPTSLVNEGALLHTYEALSPGFSYFAVAGKSMPTTSVEEGEAEIDGFGADMNETENQTAVNVKDASNETSDEAESMPWYVWAIGVLLLLVLIIYGYYRVVTRTPSSDEFEDHTVVKAHMKRLEKFVDKALEKGYKKEQLKERLVDSGWDERLVEFVLRRK